MPSKYGNIFWVQEIYSKNLTLLEWSGAHWRKLFSTGEKEKNTNDANYSTGGDFPENCVEFNYSTGNRVKTTQDANYLTGALI